jgi:hypothetical protein
MNSFFSDCVLPLRFVCAGAAESVFVHGSSSESMRCTLPFSRIFPEFRHSSDIGAQTTTTLTTIVPEISKDMVDLLDTHIERLVASLQETEMGSIRHESLPMSTTSNSKPKQSPLKQSQQVPKPFMIGDRIRLRPNLKYRDTYQDEVGLLQSSSVTDI